MVKAAGGVVVRDGLVAVIHRPKYDDWSLPKGKLERGESWEDAALREVREETGLVCRLGEELGPPREYVDRKGRPKTVRYWVMEVESDPGFGVNDEVDELRWLSPPDAAALLNHASDRALLTQLSSPG